MNTPAPAALPTSDEIARLQELLHAATRIAVFTGAGISTESGIPDFRGPGGVWTRMKPIYFQEFLASADLRREAWRRRFSNEDRWVGAKPNRGHEAVATLLRMKKAFAVITQNVDNLHQESGIPAEQMIELHGNATYAHCLNCRTRYELSALEQEFRATGDVGPCQRCGGIIKTATVSFGQGMPAMEMQRAQDATTRCDLMLVLGSSLTVFPAADIPRQAKEYGATLSIINAEPTPLDAAADLTVHASIGATLAPAVAALNALSRD